MADLVVDTTLLQRAGVELTEVAQIARTLGDRGGRLSALVPAVGRHRAAQAVAAFGEAWLYGVGWIAAQAQDVSRQLTVAAAAYAAVEARLAVGIGPIPPAQLPPAATACSTTPTRPNWALLAPTVAPPVQLSSATHAAQLVPGDPDVVRAGARIVADFADELGQSRAVLHRVALGCWIGEAARSMTAQLTSLSDRLRKAEAAFLTAADALTRYAAAHLDARDLAVNAMRTWAAAAHASAVARGAVVAGTGGAVLLPTGVDPAAEMARAVALLRTGHEILDQAERALVAALEDALRGAPTDPGQLAQFTIGLEEGLTGIVGGTGDMAVLAARLSPHRLAYDPQGWLDDHEAFWSGVGHAITHLPETGKALVDWDTWASSPWRAAGKFAPEVLAALYTLGTAAAAGHLSTASRLREVADGVDTAKRDGTLYDPVDEDMVTRRISELGHGPDSPAALAATWQLYPPYGVPDHWVPITLQPGQRYARIGDYLTPVDDLPSSAREFSESLQLHPSRHRDSDGDVLQPAHFASVEIYEVSVRVEAAAARAVANPQFGIGGGTNISVPDLDDVIDADVLKQVDGAEGVHRFDPDTLESTIEDPAFKAVDSTLPDEALDPDLEALRESGRVGVEEARDYPIGVAASAAADNLEQSENPDQIEQGVP